MSFHIVDYHPSIYTDYEATCLSVCLSIKEILPEEVIKRITANEFQKLSQYVL